MISIAGYSSFHTTFIVKSNVGSLDASDYGSDAVSYGGSATGSNCGIYMDQMLYHRYLHLLYRQTKYPDIMREIPGASI